MKNVSAPEACQECSAEKHMHTVHRKLAQFMLVEGSILLYIPLKIHWGNIRIRSLWNIKSQETLFWNWSTSFLSNNLSRLLNSNIHHPSALTQQFSFQWCGQSPPWHLYCSTKIPPEAGTACEPQNSPESLTCSKFSLITLKQEYVHRIWWPTAGTLTHKCLLV